MVLNPLSNYSFVVDLETSGSDPDKFGVITCAALIIDQNDNIVDRFCRLVKPPMLSPRTWDKEAEIKAHKIPFEKVWFEGISNEQFCYELLCWVGQFRPQLGYMPFICHASKQGKRKLTINNKDSGTYEIWPRFDWHFLERSMRKAQFDNGLEMVWSFWKLFHMEESFISTVNMGRDAGYKKNSLDVWAERVRFPLTHHDAMSDVLCCLEVYKYIKARGRNGENELDISNDNSSDGIPF